MTDEITAPELDDNGNPIVPTESEGADITPKQDVTPEPPEDFDNLEVPVRSSAQHIIARKNRQIEKLRSKIETEEYTPDSMDDADNDDSKPLTKGDLKPLIDSITGSSDENELKNLLASDPTAKKYEKAIRVYMDHPAWKAVPVQAIYHHLAFNAAANAGAKRKQVADLEASNMRGAGTSHRPTGDTGLGIPSADEIANMSEAEFEELQNKTRTGTFTKKSSH